MKIRITAEYEVTREARTGWYEILDSGGLVLTRAEDLGVAMHSLAGMVENEMLDPEAFEIQIIDVLEDPPLKIEPSKLPQYYECGICDHWHAEDFNGDCRADDARFFTSDLDEMHGLNGWESVAMPGSEDHA